LKVGSEGEYKCIQCNRVVRSKIEKETEDEVYRYYWSTCPLCNTTQVVATVKKSETRDLVLVEDVEIDEETGEVNIKTTRVSIPLSDLYPLVDALLTANKILSKIGCYVEIEKHPDSRADLYPLLVTEEELSIIQYALVSADDLWIKVGNHYEPKEEIKDLLDKIDILESEIDE